MHRRVLPLAIAIVTLFSCGKKSGGPTTPSPTTPTTPARAAIALTMSNVVGSRTAPGYVYTLQTRWQETAGVSATITSFKLTFLQGTTTVGTVDGTADISSPQVAAGSTGAINWTITDNNAGHPFATSVQAALTYTDTAGSQTASTSAPVPPLADAPTTFSVCGTVRDGASVVSDIVVTIVGTSLSATTDQQGHFCFSGIAAGTITLQIVRNGYNTLQQSVTVTGNTTVDLALVRQTAPSVSIDSFTADSALITKGQSTTLRWAVSNSTGVSIDNGIGSVSATGSRSVSPTALSTTYSLTAAGNGGPKSRSVTIITADPNAMTCTVPVPSGVTAICNDGTYSMSQNNSGTCSSHSGVRCWVCPGPLCKQ